MSDIEDSNDLLAIFNSLLNKPENLIKHHIDSINKFNECEKSENNSSFSGIILFALNHISTSSGFNGFVI